jgi:transposase-like protein
LKHPKLRNTTEQFASQILGKDVLRTNPLEALEISGRLRGLSDRDIEALLAESLGPEAALSQSTVSRICERLRDEFETSRPVTCPTSNWTTCPWTARSSRCTTVPPPSRCWSPTG